MLKTGAGRTVRAFFSWWLAELRSLLPAAVRRALFPTGVAAILHIDENEIVLSRTTRNEARELGKIDTEDRAEGAVASKLRALVEQHHLRRSRAEMILAGGSVLERSVDLPLDAADNLPEVLTFEMDRLTPFSPEEVYYDYRVTGSDLENKRLHVTMAIARRPEVDRAVSWVRAAGLEPVSATAPVSHGKGHAPLSVLPSKSGGGQADWLTRMVLALFAVFVVVSGIAVYLPLKEGERDLKAARERIGELRAIAAEVAGLDSQVADLQERREFLSNAKLNRSMSIEILSEVTQRLPDSSWLVQFNLREQQLRLAGYADNPANLIRLLEQSPTLSNVRFTSPVTKDPREQKDRFNLSAEVASGRQP